VLDARVEGVHVDVHDLPPQLLRLLALDLWFHAFGHHMMQRKKPCSRWNPGEFLRRPSEASRGEDASLRRDLILKSGAAALSRRRSLSGIAETHTFDDRTTANMEVVLEICRSVPNGGTSPPGRFHNVSSLSLKLLLGCHHRPRRGVYRAARGYKAVFDVYLNGRSDLLVVPSGKSVPSELSGNWRKKRAVRAVSERIREDVQLRGYHRRKLVSGDAPASKNTNRPV
jgi:hypothetical protein